MFDLEERLGRALDRFGGFTQITASHWVELETCQICLDVHTPRSVRLVDPNSMTTAEIYQSGPVRLSDGSNEVSISFGPSCEIRPFRNLTKLLARQLSLRPITDHQVFDSIEHLHQALVFSLPGHFYEWDGVELSAWEQLSIQTGHLIKKHYQRPWDYPVIDFSIELHETHTFESDQFGLTIGRYGLLCTFWGQEFGYLEQVAGEFQAAIDAYAQILAHLNLTARAD